MSLPLNPAIVATPSSIQSLPQARMWVERFARPQGFSPYAWNTTKRIALKFGNVTSQAVHFAEH